MAESVTSQAGHGAIHRLPTEAHHLRGDYAPLHHGEIVPVEVEIIPNTGLIRRGHRLRIDIQPYTGVGHGMRHAYEKAYHDGAQNTIFTGPKHPSYVQLPFLPPRGS